MHSLRTDAETGNAAREASRRVNRSRAASYLLALLLLLVLWADLAAGAEAQGVCTVTNNATKEYYNLQRLMRDSKDWEVKGQEEGQSYIFNLHVCGKIESKSDVTNPEEMGAYLQSVSYDGAGKSLGKYNTKPYLQGKRLMLKYTDGSRCHSNGDVRHTTIIAFTCDSSVGEDNPPVFLGSSNDCGFFFEWSTPFACASYQPDGGKSGWSVFFTILIIAILVYVIGGVAYNRSVYNATGISQLPHAEFWSNVWDYMKDLSLILVYQLPCFKPAVHTRSYRNLPRDEEAELMDDNFGED